MSYSMHKRRRAWQEAQEQKREAKPLGTKEKPTEAKHEPQEDAELTIEQVKEELERLGVKFSHNTGEKKLREKLENATK